MTRGPIATVRLRSPITMIAGGGCGVLLVAAGMWTWQQGAAMTVSAGNAEVIAWAVRSVAVAAVALGQAVFLFTVVGGVYPANGFDVLLRVIATAVFVIGVISAIALALAGR